MKTLELANRILAIFFDIGDTLRNRVPDPATQAQATLDFLSLLQPRQPAEVFLAQVEQRYSNYQHWRQESLIEASEQELWTQWLLPNYSPESIAPVAGRLTDLWRLRGGRGIWCSDAAEVVRELHQRGYILGVISNTISASETPRLLDEMDLTPLFSAIILSSTFGKRKPDPEIFIDAARRANVTPDRCAHIGDRPSRDVVGCKRAGFAMSILMAGVGTEQDQAAGDEPEPDLTINSLSELLEIFQGASKD